LNIHEFQSQNILKKFGINVPRQGVASSVEEARKVAEVLGMSWRHVVLRDWHALIGGCGDA
jgi:succinyl-CoA synthetase beta subunit